MGCVPLLLGCSIYGDGKASLHLNSNYYNFLQPSFERYVAISKDWLFENRQFITEHHDAEIQMNAPYQLKPVMPTDKAVLLVHGLADSPFTFHDLAQDLHKQGFLVQVLLLPGHGSSPANLSLPSVSDWQNIVDHYADLLRANYSNVWLGGFSTGANLATTYALQNDDIDGLLLFSPGFKSKAGNWEAFVSVVASIFEWQWDENETNIAKYNSGSLNAAKAYIDSASRVRSMIDKNKSDIPTLVVVSEHDSVIDVSYTKTVFNNRFTNQKNRLIWYGETIQEDIKISQKSMKIPSMRISTASHMGVLFKPCNYHYGLSSGIRICDNGRNNENTVMCENATDVWYSAWGYEEKGKIHARLTWNPHYADMLEQILSIMAG